MSGSNSLPLLIPPHITDLRKHFIRELRNSTQYSHEIQFLKRLENDGEDFPVIQLTPEILEMYKLHEDEDITEDEADNEDNTLLRASAFYYCGNRFEDLQSHKDTTHPFICRCPKWHLIVSPQMYYLVDRQYTLFEVLKGNTRNDGYITKGLFFGDDGRLICKCAFDLKQSMYSITHVGRGMVFE